MASQLRFGMGLLAWLTPIPFLRYLRITRGWKSRAAFLAASLLALNLATAKILTAPLPLYFAPLFAVPLSLLLTPPYLLWAWLRPRVGEGLGLVAFAALMVVGEWVSHALLPLGTWGAAANTQLEFLPLLQLASITGLHGVSFLVYLTAAALEACLDGLEPGRIRWAALALGAVLAAGVFGEARLAAASGQASETRRVAAVGTDATFGGLPLPSREEKAAIEAGLFRRTRLAARAGARLVVFAEAAALVLPEDEPGWLERLRTLAREERVHLVAAYVVPRSLEPLRFENKYAFVTAQGVVDHQYLKHHPVPGEPAIRGEAPLPLFVDDELGRVSGAICYDYDFPRLALKHAALEADLVALPSSDWRGIDPLHTQMAALRAIETGHSIVRSTRFGLSAGIDPYGRLRGWLSHWDDAERVLVVNLPRHGVRTVYGTLGDWFPLTCLGFSLIAGGLALRRRRA